MSTNEGWCMVLADTIGVSVRKAIYEDVLNEPLRPCTGGVCVSHLSLSV